MKTTGIHNKIFSIRGQKVMLDFDLAMLYEVENPRKQLEVAFCDFKLSGTRKWPCKSISETKNVQHKIGYQTKKENQE